MSLTWSAKWRPFVLRSSQSFAETSSRKRTSQHWWTQVFVRSYLIFYYLSKASPTTSQSLQIPFEIRDEILPLICPSGGHCHPICLNDRFLFKKVTFLVIFVLLSHQDPLSLKLTVVSSFRSVSSVFLQGTTWFDKRSAKYFQKYALCCLKFNWICQWQDLPKFKSVLGISILIYFSLGHEKWEATPLAASLSVLHWSLSELLIIWKENWHLFCNRIREKRTITVINLFRCTNVTEAHLILSTRRSFNPNVLVIDK